MSGFPGCPLAAFPSGTDVAGCRSEAHAAGGSSEKSNCSSCPQEAGHLSSDESENSRQENGAGGCSSGDGGRGGSGDEERQGLLRGPMSATSFSIGRKAFCKPARPRTHLMYAVSMMAKMAAAVCLLTGAITLGAAGVEFEIDQPGAFEDNNLLNRAAACGSPWSTDCFNRNRCVGPSGAQELSIYVHDAVCSNSPSTALIASNSNDSNGNCGSVCIAALSLIREKAQAKGLLAERPEEACLIVAGLRTGHRCVSRSSTWDDGRNHLIIDFNDQQRSYFSDVDGGLAMFASSNMQTSYFRYGHDIPVPLPPKHTFGYLADVAPNARRYFATFKGHLYLSGGGVVERTTVRQIASSTASPDVIVVENCQEKHKEHLLPENLDLCQGLLEEFSKQDYADLMNSTFALIPAGRSPATFRLGEALSAGAIPVFLHEGYVKPFPTKIPWDLCSFSFPIAQAEAVLGTLRGIPEKTLLEMQAVGVKVFEEYFQHGIDGIVDITLDILEKRLSFRSERA